jgi:DNA-binding response OmpR family regulator
MEVKMAQAKKILVVDDEKDILDFVSRVLTDGGYKVFTALDANQGLELLKKEQIDLLLLDIMLPQVDGWEIMKIMKKDVQLKDIPVAMLTARVDSHNKIIGLKEGAVDYICKPFTADELLNRVNEIFKYMNEQ